MELKSFVRAFAACKITRTWLCLPTLAWFLYSQIFSVETGSVTEAGMRDKRNMHKEMHKLKACRHGEMEKRKIVCHAYNKPHDAIQVILWNIPRQTNNIVLLEMISVDLTKLYNCVLNFLLYALRWYIYIHI